MWLAMSVEFFRVIDISKAQYFFLLFFSLVHVMVIPCGPYRAMLRNISMVKLVILILRLLWFNCTWKKHYYPILISCLIIFISHSRYIALPILRSLYCAPYIALPILRSLYCAAQCVTITYARLGCYILYIYIYLVNKLSLLWTIMSLRLEWVISGAKAALRRRGAAELRDI